MLAATRTAHDFCNRNSILRIVIWVIRCRIVKGKRRLFDDQVTRRPLKVIVRSKAEVIIVLFGRAVDPLALVAGKWSLFVICGNDVLTKFWAKFFEQIPTMANHRKVTQDRVAFLKQVVNRHCSYDQQDYSQSNQPTHFNLQLDVILISEAHSNREAASQSTRHTH